MYKNLSMYKIWFVILLFPCITLLFGLGFDSPTFHRVDSTGNFLVLTSPKK